MRVTTNAVNFIDGLDGLAAGIVAIAALAFFIYSYLLSYTFNPPNVFSTATFVTAATLGCCLGFLPHNFNPARLFMGDSGALLLGLLLAAATISITGNVDPSAVSGDQVTAALLTNYAKVVWMLGEESTVDETFSSAEQAAVTNYLGKGGRLFVSGAEIGWDLGRSGVSSSADVNFFTNVLRAVYASDSGGTGQVTGTTGGFLSGVSIGFNYTNLLPDTYAANWPDVLRTGSGAVTAAVYGASSSGTSGAIVQYSNSTYRTIVMGFPFETITNETTRATVMTKAMSIAVRFMRFILNCSSSIRRIRRRRLRRAGNDRGRSAAHRPTRGPA